MSIKLEDRIELLTLAVHAALTCVELIARSPTNTCNYCQGPWTRHTPYCSVGRTLYQLKKSTNEKSQLLIDARDASQGFTRHNETFIRPLSDATPEELLQFHLRELRRTVQTMTTTCCVCDKILVLHRDWADTSGNVRTICQSCDEPPKRGAK